MNLFLGIDGGGTHCRAAVIDEQGSIVFQGNAGSTNLTSISEDVVERNIRAALDAAPRVCAAAGCFAGLIDDHTASIAGNILTSLLPGISVDVYPDYFGTLEAMPEEADMLVIAGTGSVICSKQGDVVVKSGGGGYILGDQGSCCDLGKRLMAATCVNMEPCSERLLEAIEETFGSRSPAAALMASYRSATPAVSFAKLAVAVVEQAQAGELLALRVVRESLAGLAKLAIDHYSRFGTAKEPVCIAIDGGLWQTGNLVEHEFESALREYSRNISQSDSISDRNRDLSRQYTLVRLQVPPVVGAAMLARKKYNGN